MATRAHLREQITSDKIGALTPVALASVAVYETGTATPVAATMYQTATGVGTFTNPLTADANGVVEFWMTNAQVVDLAITAAGYNTATVTAQVIGTDTATGIVNLNTTATPAQAGDVQVNGENFTYEGATSLHTVSTLDQAQTITGAKKMSALTVVNAADNTKALSWDLSGATTAATMTVKSSQTVARTLTLPDATDTLVGRATADTLANKTLTTPVITGSGGTLTLPAGPDTLVGRATTDTLTNKTLTAPTITGAASVTSTGNTDLSGATATTGLKIPSAAGAAPTAAGTVAFDLTSNRPVAGDGTHAVPLGPAAFGFANGGASVGAGATLYLLIGFAAGGTTYGVPVPNACTLTKLYVDTNAAAGTGQSYTYTLYKNGTATTLTCSISGASAVAASDTAHSVTCVTGDYLALQVVTSAGATSGAQHVGGVGL